MLSLIPSAIGRFASKLRFPQLFLITASLFLVDLVVPDLIPFIDEILLGLLSVLFGMWQQSESSETKPPMKDVTPGKTP
ncbi:MAG: DUF6116 family protein [Thermoanaerobaculia bacterium]|nr:DUF6116 family protein [Thermoanaerobaculia bacterium]